MPYSYEQIFSKNDDLINELIAEYIMGEPKPTHEALPHTFSQKGWWMCIEQFGENQKCEWSAVNFAGSFRWCWDVIRYMHNDESITVKQNFRYFRDRLSPLDAVSEAEACRKICRAALLAKLDTVLKPF